MGRNQIPLIDANKVIEWIDEENMTLGKLKERLINEFK